MLISPIYSILSEIRVKYGGKEVSLIDIRLIEEKYKLCSIVNTRETNCAFLRINYFGIDNIMFEDVVTDYSCLVFDKNDIHGFIFKISKLLYEAAYGIILIDENKKILSSYPKPSITYSDLKSEIVDIKKHIKKLEKEKDNNNYQVSTFDLFR